MWLNWLLSPWWEQVGSFPGVCALGPFPSPVQEPCSGGSQQPRHKGLGLRGRKLSPRALAMQSLSSANAEVTGVLVLGRPRGSLRTEVSRGRDSSPAPALVPGFLETRVRTEKQHWIREQAFVSWVFFVFFYWSCFY